MTQLLTVTGLVAVYAALGITAVRTQEGTNFAPIIVPFERAPTPYIVIRVPAIGGRCEAMLFDTGTNMTLLEPGPAARAGLSVGQATTVESLNGVARAIKGEVRGIGFEGVPAVGPRVAIATNIPGLQGLGLSVAGVFGHDWLVGTDYLIDYELRRVIIRFAGTFPPSSSGHRTALSWTAGLPVVEATVRAHAAEPRTARLVLDSGTDHLTLFGDAASWILPTGGTDRTMVIDSGFGTREVPMTIASVSVGGRERSVSVEVRKDLADREEDGLLPTSLFRSVLVSSADSSVIFDASLPLSKNPQPSTSCDAVNRHY